MGRDLRVGVAGATGALGTELVKVLDGAPWRPDTLVPLASARTETPFVSWGDGQVAVDDLDLEQLEGLSALFVALPREVAGDVVRRAMHAGVPVVDCSGSQAQDLEVPCLVPWINPEALLEDRARDVIAVPSAAGLLVASVAGPMARAGFTGSLDATVVVPASVWGRSGIDELSRQVVALFNSGAAPRKVFEHGLAFDLLPMVGDVGVTGWTGPELQALAEVARITGLRTSITLVAAPVFTGISATIRLDGGAGEPARVERVLVDGGLKAPADSSARRVPRPRRVDGRPFAHLGRVRQALGSEAVHLWVSMDNVHTVATAAVASMAMLLGDRARDEAGGG